MKKTITKKDGTVEVFEGTPEELAEWERRLNETPVRTAEKKKEKQILNEEFIRRALQMRQERSHDCDLGCFYLGRPWWGVIPPPPCSSPTCPGMTQYGRQITFTTTSDKTTSTCPGTESIGFSDPATR